MSFIQDLSSQKNYLKMAIKATDIYLGILEDVKQTGFATKPIVEEFTKNVEMAHNALTLLGVEDQHENYISKCIDDFKFYIPTAQEEQIFRSFKNFVEDFDHSEIDSIVDEIEWEDIYDMYTEDELIYDPDPEEIEEKISAQSRMKKSMAMRRNSPRVSIARNLKLRRTSSMDVLKKRAVNAARRAVYKKILMGRDKSNLSASEKDMIEKRLKSMKYMQAAIAIKMLPKLKTIEQSRLANRTKRK